MTSLLAAISEVASPIAIFLDDAHLLQKMTSRALLPYLMRNPPANLQVIVASRVPYGHWLAGNIPWPLPALASGDIISGVLFWRYYKQTAIRVN
jgi:hypothetical protein